MVWACQNWGFPFGRCPRQWSIGSALELHAELAKIQRPRPADSESSRVGLGHLQFAKVPELTLVPYLSEKPLALISGFQIIFRGFVENLRVRSLALQKPIHSYFHIAVASPGTWAKNCCLRAPGGSSGDREAQGQPEDRAELLVLIPSQQSSRPRSRLLSVLDSYKTVLLKKGLEGERRLKVQRSQKLAVGSPGQAPLSF